MQARHAILHVLCTIITVRGPRRRRQSRLEGLVFTLDEYMIAETRPALVR